MIQKIQYMQPKSNNPKLNYINKLLEVSPTKVPAEVAAIQGIPVAAQPTTTGYRPTDMQTNPSYSVKSPQTQDFMNVLNDVKSNPVNPIFNGYTWNDEALKQAQFDAFEIERLKSNPQANQGTIDYLVSQGWINPTSQSPAWEPPFQPPPPPPNTPAIPQYFPRDIDDRSVAPTYSAREIDDRSIGTPGAATPTTSQFTDASEWKATGDYGIDLAAATALMRKVGINIDPNQYLYILNGGDIYNKSVDTPYPYNPTRRNSRSGGVNPF